MKPFRQNTVAPVSTCSLPFYVFKVCPPSLHVSLGVWFKLFTILEEECCTLLEGIADTLARDPEQVSSLPNGPFPLHVAKLSEVFAARDRAQEIKRQIDDL